MKQHEDALEKANEIRLERARIRRETKAAGYRASRRLVAEMLRDPPAEAVAGMTLIFALRCCSRMGEARALLLLERQEVQPWRLRVQLRNLTEREIAAIAAGLETA